MDKLTLQLYNVNFVQNVSISTFFKFIIGYITVELKWFKSGNSSYFDYLTFNLRWTPRPPRIFYEVLSKRSASTYAIWSSHIRRTLSLADPLFLRRRNWKTHQNPRWRSVGRRIWTGWPVYWTRCARSSLVWRTFEAVCWTQTGSCEWLR